MHRSPLVRFTRQAALCVAISSYWLAGQSAAVLLDQVDDFQAGTTAGWHAGFNHPSPPFVAPDIGPGGVGDDAMVATASGGVGAGSRLALINDAQWGGDYLAEGILWVGLDVRVNSGSDVSLRLGLVGPGGVFSSADPTVLTSGGDWTWVVLSLEDADLVALTVGADLPTTLANVTELRLLHAAATPVLGFGGSPAGGPISAVLEVDNVTALPEPSRFVMLTTGIACLVGLTRLGSARRSCPRPPF